MIAVLSLMLPIRFQTHFALLRPFEFIVASAALGWPLIAARRGVRFPTGLLFLAPYLMWHVISANAGGTSNAAREGIQVLVAGTFAFLAAQEAHRLDLGRMSRRLLWLVGLIAVGAIVWQITHGYVIGWKHVVDPILSFVFFPPLLAGAILFSGPARRRRLWWVWIAIFPLAVMSGERKALIIYLILTVLLLARGRLALVAPVAMAAFIGLYVLSTTIADPYLQRQVHSLVDPGGTGNYQYLLETGRYAPGDTPSDVQRAFALHVSAQLFKQHPFFGVGTNQYVKVVTEEYPDLPHELQLTIHGAFQQILTENGLVGLSLYLMVWVVSFLRLARLRRIAVQAGRLTVEQARVLPFLLYIPFALFLGVEAPGTRAFVGIIIISLIPEFALGRLGEAPSRVRLQLQPSSTHAQAFGVAPLEAQ